MVGADGGKARRGRAREIADALCTSGATWVSAWWVSRPLHRSSRHLLHRHPQKTPGLQVMPVLDVQESVSTIGFHVA